MNLRLWAPQTGRYSFNIFAGLLQAAAVLLLLGGVECGKVTIKVFTILKLLLVLFMIAAGLCLFQQKHVENWTPKGVSGVFRGATSAFFGFLGYDEVCCLGGEALYPEKDLPRAIFGTIACVTVLYVLASLALVGMVPFHQIDEESGFALAFEDRGWHWAQLIVALGEIVTLPLVVVISFLAQPRLLFAMAEDGLLPGLFAEVDDRGNLYKGTLVSGAVCVLIALFVPFKYLDDMISAGVLLSFNLTNTSLVVMRRQNPRNPSSCLRLLVWYNIFSCALALLCANVDLLSFYSVFPASALVASLGMVYVVTTSCPEVDARDGRGRGGGGGGGSEEARMYRVPFMPFPPLIGIFINYFLIAQLSWRGILLICLYTGLAVGFYFLYGIKHSLGNNTQWTRALRSGSDVDDDPRGVDDMLCMMSKDAHGDTGVDVISEDVLQVVYFCSAGVGLEQQSVLLRSTLEERDDSMLEDNISEDELHCQPSDSLVRRW
jgi:amino acid transporter